MDCMQHNSVHSLFFSLCRCNQLYPNYLNSINEHDFAQIYELLQNPGDASHNFNTQIDLVNEYLENSVTIEQRYENDSLSLTDLGRV